MLRYQFQINDNSSFYNSLNYLSNLAIYIILLLHIFKITLLISSIKMSRRGRDRMIVRCTTTYAINAYHHWCCESESRSGRGVQHYVIKFVSDLVGFTQPGFNLSVYHIGCEHANHYTTCNAGRNSQINA
jgi:hypothetical protein